MTETTHPRHAGDITGEQYERAEHPNAGLIFALGIIGVLPFGFSLICGASAWYLGGHVRKEIAAGKTFRWDGRLRTGFWMGKISTIVYAVAYVVVLIVALAAQLG